MKKALQRKITGSMLLTALAVMAVVSVCLLFGMARYSSAQFESDVADVLTVDLLSEMNESATGTPESAAYSVEQILKAYEGQLRLGIDRTYSIWNAENGELLAGDETAPMTGNIVSAMNGEVGDHISLLPSRMDVAVPITGTDVTVIVDICDSGASMRAMFARLLLFLVIALILCVIMCLVLSNLFGRSFAASAVAAAQEAREYNDSLVQDTEDWHTMASAMYVPKAARKHKGKGDYDALDILLPYLKEGYVLFDIDGQILEINIAAEELLGLSVENGSRLTFDMAFRGVPMPSETQAMVRGQLNQNGKLLEVIFLSLEPGIFAAVLHPADRRTV